MKHDLSMELNTSVAADTRAESITSSANVTLADRVLSEIQTSIIKGQLPAGSKINEQALAQRYGISRGPTREALQTLEQRRLIVRVPHVGARVAELTVDELNDLYQLRSVLECMACELAAQNITQIQLEKLQQVLTKQEAALTNGDSYFQEEGDVDFHYQIIQASGNKHLQETLVGGLYHLLRMYRYQCTNESRPVKAIADHRRIVEAIASRDSELAGLLMRRHIEQGRINTEVRLKELQTESLV